MGADSAFIVGGISDEEGRFRLPLAENAALVKISYIGYQDQVLPASAGYSEMGDILLREDTHLLGEVVVKGQLPKTRIKGDAMVTTVAGSLLEKAGTAVDVLSKVPGMTRKGEDLNVFGRGTPQVYINGREVRDPSELTQLTSDNIRSLEVITNPGIRYDKTVKAVIRVQTKKQTDDGFGFADRAYVNYNDKWSYLDQYWEQKNHSSQTFTTQAWTANMALNYTFDPDRSLGVNYRYRRYPKSTNALSLQTDIDKDHSFFEKSQAQIVGEMPENWRSLTLFPAGHLLSAANIRILHGRVGSGTTKVYWPMTIAVLKKG